MGPTVCHYHGLDKLPGVSEGAPAMWDPQRRTWSGGGSSETGRHLLVLQISRCHLDDPTLNLLPFMSITQVNFPHYSQRELFESLTNN